ncbi:MAG: YqeG family HAD IIIA-type phosphatase [Candidatus Sericytochromatia bacterium]|nr:YqeG family HAD IIIA-type phosphatase [Candidatus Sericytochromatia bacterium]
MRRRRFGQWLSPHRVHRSLAEIDLDELAAHGIRGILMDLDDTLCPRDSSVTPEPIMVWLKAAAERFQLFIVSNNFSLERVRIVSDALSIPGIHGAQKPRRSGINHAMTQLGLQRHELVLIGDRLLTDVLASRRAGIMAILVEPILAERRFLSLGVRLLEANLLRLFGETPFQRHDPPAGADS